MANLEAQYFPIWHLAVFVSIHAIESLSNPIREHVFVHGGLEIVFGTDDT